MGFCSWRHRQRPQRTSTRSSWPLVSPRLRSYPILLLDFLLLLLLLLLLLHQQPHHLAWVCTPASLPALNSSCSLRAVVSCRALQPRSSPRTSHVPAVVGDSTWSRQRVIRRREGVARRAAVSCSSPRGHTSTTSMHTPHRGFFQGPPATRRVWGRAGAAVNTQPVFTIIHAGCKYSRMFVNQPSVLTVYVHLHGTVDFTSCVSCV